MHADHRVDLRYSRGRELARIAFQPMPATYDAKYVVISVPNGRLCMDPNLPLGGDPVRSQQACQGFPRTGGGRCRSIGIVPILPAS